MSDDPHLDCCPPLLAHATTRVDTGSTTVAKEVATIAPGLCYVALAGRCACGMAPFHELDGIPVDLFVPEAGCPIHDYFGTWRHTVIERIKDAVALLRDFCESMYAGYPDEEAEEALAAALGAEGRRAQGS